MAWAKALNPIEMLCPPWKNALKYPRGLSILGSPPTSLSDAGVRKNGSTIIGMPDSTDGIASIEMRPLAKVYSKVRLLVSSESMKGIYPLYFPPSKSGFRLPIYSLPILSTIITTTFFFPPSTYSRA